MPLPPSISVVQTISTSIGGLAFRADGDGKPLLLLQRFRGTIDDWDPAFIEALVGSGRRVIRFDNVGIGRSPGTTPDSVIRWADTALAFADAAGLDRFDLLGWSMGGMVAQWMALKAPERITHLVLAATSPGAITEHNTANNARVMEIRRKTQTSVDDFLYLFFSHDEHGRRLGSESVARISAASDGPGVSEEATAAQLAAQKNFNSGRDATRAQLARLAVPTLVANGNADVMQPPFGSYAIATEARDAKLLLYPNAGHAFLFQCLDSFTGEVVRFLEA